MCEGCGLIRSDGGRVDKNLFRVREAQFRFTLGANQYVHGLCHVATIPFETSETKAAWQIGRSEQH